MANRCPSCGGTLRFDIAQQKLVCEYCDSAFAPEEIAQMGGAGESEAFGQTEAGDTNAAGGAEDEGGTMTAKIFTCPNCGAEVFATDLDAVEYCSYCGTFVTLESRLAKLQKPSYIVPFTVTKDKCMELYRQHLKNARFLPADMKADKAESSFHSIYIPFWVYELNYDQNSPVSVSTRESWTSGNTQYTQEYTIEAHADGCMGGIFYDASATLEDRISEQIRNFPQDSLQAYNSSLMAGSYADVADVKKSVYEDEVYAQGKSLLLDEIRDGIARQGRAAGVRSPSALSGFTSQQDVRSYSAVEAKLAMLPVWFMTWKNRNRLCYAVVNGNTGKMFAEVPSDLKKYTLSSILLSIPIFFLLESFLTLMPKTLLIVTAVLALVVLLRYWSVSNRLKRQDNRSDDKGYQHVFGSLRQEGGGNSFALGSIVSVASLALAAVLLYLDMPDDLPYYGGSLLCIAGSFVAIASLVRAHNLSCSRPIPHFFDKRKNR